MHDPRYRLCTHLHMTRSMSQLAQQEHLSFSINQFMCRRIGQRA